MNRENQEKQASGGMKAVWQALEMPWFYDVFSFCVGANPYYRRLLRDHAKVRQGERVLDIGCGTGRILGLLPPVDYVGFDPNPDYILKAQRTRAGQGEFFVGAIGQPVAVPENSFDVVFALGILHHLPDEWVRDLSALAHRSLKVGGRLVTSDGAFSPGQSRLARAMVARDRGRHVREVSRYLELLGHDFSEIHSTVLQDGVRIPYTHLVTCCVKR